jgi:hypothetical protein
MSNGASGLPSNAWWKMRTMTRDLSCAEEVVPRLRPIITEWKITPDSRIEKAISSSLKDGLGRGSGFGRDSCGVAGDVTSSLSSVVRAGGGRDSRG